MSSQFSPSKVGKPRGDFMGFSTPKLAFCDKVDSELLPLVLAWSHYFVVGSASVDPPPKVVATPTDFTPVLLAVHI